MKNLQRENIKPVKAEGIYKYIGLMFKRESYTTPMEFNFDKPTLHPIHTWFCNFPIRCIYYDEKGEIIEDVVLDDWCSYHIPPRPYVKLLEIPNPDSTTKTKEKKEILRKMELNGTNQNGDKT
jgi:uncharacterized membrane protein (UPF0127 family)